MKANRALTTLSRACRDLEMIMRRGLPAPPPLIATALGIALFLACPRIAGAAFNNDDEAYVVPSPEMLEYQANLQLQMAKTAAAMNKGGTATRSASGPDWNRYLDSTQTLSFGVFKDKVTHERWRLAHIRRVYECQLLASLIIFIAVIGLVIIGVYFAGIQFQRSVVLAKEHADRNVTEIGVTTQGFHFSSATLGVVILFMALLFFYLYLIHVHDIRVVGANALDSSEITKTAGMSAPVDTSRIPRKTGN